MLRSTLSTTEDSPVQEKPIREKTLQELQAEKAHFESLASYSHHYPYQSKKGEAKGPKIFLKHQDKNGVWHSMKRVILSFLF